MWKRELGNFSQTKEDAINKMGKLLGILALLGDLKFEIFVSLVIVIIGLGSLWFKVRVQARKILSLEEALASLSANVADNYRPYVDGNICRVVEKTRVPTKEVSSTADISDTSDDPTDTEGTCTDRADFRGSFVEDETSVTPDDEDSSSPPVTDTTNNDASTTSEE